MIISNIISSSQTEGYDRPQSAVKIDSVQYLRGLAALMVVLYHAFPQIERMGYALKGPVFLSAGVDIFFVISGFVMVYSTSRHPTRGGVAFLRDRILRIVPLYWALSLAMVGLLVAVPSVAQTSKFDISHAIASFLFVPWLHPVANKYWPMITVGWTLNYEMFFYLIFGAALCIARRRRPLVIGLSCLVLVCIAAVPAVAPVEGVLGFYTSSIILEFGFGMVLCEAFLRAPNCKSIYAWIMVILGFVGLTIPNVRDLGPAGFSVGIPALLIVTGFLFIPLDLKGLWKTFAKTVGDASYSIYLSHYMVMSAFGQVWRKLMPHFPDDATAFAVVSVTVCLSAGICVFWLVERPLTRLASSAFGTKPSSVVVA
ncbi:MAG: acyltransferase [Spirochaetia bacterium]|nr:MAG: acyltransferase [Spirochaetia bacterium]